MEGIYRKKMEIRGRTRWNQDRGEGRGEASIAAPSPCPPAWACVCQVIEREHTIKEGHWNWKREQGNLLWSFPSRSPSKQESFLLLDIYVPTWRFLQLVSHIKFYLWRQVDNLLSWKRFNIPLWVHLGKQIQLKTDFEFQIKSYNKFFLGKTLEFNANNVKHILEKILDWDVSEHMWSEHSGHWGRRTIGLRQQAT